jgi:hypothetical protein
VIASLDPEAGEAGRSATLAREAKGGLLDLTKLVTASVDEGRRAMDERERELRATYGLDDVRGATQRP